MKPLMQKIWLEPAAFIGFLTSLALAVGALLAGSDWSWETVVAVIAPLASSLGIRQLVVPMEKATRPDPQGTTYAKEIK
jgi:membrane protein implicated in regulation of membrane protease activity